MRRMAGRPAALAMAVIVALAAMFPATATKAGTNVDTRAKTKSGLTEDQRIVHLLNRTGYGPRPGDIERVKRIGIDKYIELQLHPERVNDSAIEARLTGLDSLHMSTREMNEKYPQPAMVARDLGLLKQDLKAGKAVGKGETPEQPKAEDKPEDLAAKLQSREYRQQVMQYYSQHGLKPPQRLLQELQAQKLIRAVYSERQLEEVVSDFWFNHFNVDWRKGGDKWMTTDYEMNTIRPHVLGKFKDLLLATAKSPAMLFYLDNFQSMSPDTKLPQPGQRRRPPQVGGIGLGRVRPNRPVFGPTDPIYRQQQAERDREMREANSTAQQQRPKAAGQVAKRKPGINENYARELMELHTLGVDGGYTQKDVQEVARCFTGWTIDRPRQGGGFVFRSFMHDDGEKNVLGHKIPAGGGQKDGEMVIDILSHSPNTAKFIATKLTRKFVSDRPPQALIDRVAATYARTDGDIREMLRTILTSPEFNSKEAYRSKIKSPFELTASAIRALGGDTTGSPQLAAFVAKMGQPLYQYQAPTGYPDRAEQWVNTGALLERLNFGLALSANKIPGALVDVEQVAPGAAKFDEPKLMERAITLLLQGDASTQTRAVLDKQLKEGVPVKGEPVDDAMLNRKNGPDEMDTGAAMMKDDQQRYRPTDKVARKDEALERRGQGLGMVAKAGPPIDPHFALVFGLVLGTPEFQRR